MRRRRDSPSLRDPSKRRFGQLRSPSAKGLLHAPRMTRGRGGGDEGNLGREVSPEDPRRGRRPGRDRRAAQGICEGGEPPAPPLRGPRGHRQDDLRDGPGARHVRRELAPELLRAEQQRRARHRDRPHEGQRDRAPRALRRDELQDHLPRRGRQPDRGRAGGDAPHDGDVFEDFAVHLVRELLVAPHRTDPIADGRLPVPTAEARGDPRIRLPHREGGETQDHG